uniref:Uncharacterized protein n=1 Tax=Avena sativa TaxID=4498 RepID=A0ACD5WJS7_AVESA
MALRFLVTRMPTTAAAALKTPPVSRGSPASHSRPFSAPPRQVEQHPKGKLDLESATKEELMRETELLSKKADETLAHVWEYNEKLIPGVLRNVCKRIGIMACFGCAAEITSWMISSREPTVGHSE